MKRATNKTLQEGLQIYGLNLDTDYVHIDVHLEGRNLLSFMWCKKKQMFIDTRFSSDVKWEEIEQTKPLFTTKKEELINWIKKELL